MVVSMMLNEVGVKDWKGDRRGGGVVEEMLGGLLTSQRSH